MSEEKTYDELSNQIWPVRAYNLTTSMHGIGNIALKRLKISRLRDLNDPYELLAFEESERQARADSRQWKTAFDEKYGLLCFSRSWKNPVLWSHYAEKHRGICLGFDLHKSCVVEVTYTPKRIPARFKNGDRTKGLDEDFVKDLLRTKFEHWTYGDSRFS